MAAADQIDPHLKSALLKQRSGGQLTHREQSAIRKYEKLQREKWGAAYLKETPKRDVLAETGVSNKTWLEWVDRYGAPWQPHGKAVDLFALLRWATGVIAEASPAINKFLKSKRSQAAVDEFMPDMSGVDWQDECFKEKAWELADKRKLRRREMLHAETVGEVHARIAMRLVEFGDGLGKRYGEEAQRLFSKAMEDIQADVMGLFGHDGDDGSYD